MSFFQPIVYTTRRGATYAAGAMLVGGIGIQVVGWTIRRDTRTQYRAISTSTPAWSDIHGTLPEVLDRLFSRQEV